MTIAPWIGATAVAAMTGGAFGVATWWAARPTACSAGRSDRRASVRERAQAAWRRAAATSVVTRALGWWRARRTSRTRLAQLPEFVDGVVRSIRAGTSLQVAVRDGAEVVGAPLLDDVARVERDVALGIPWAEALRRWSERVGSDDLALVTTACALGVEMGRGTADALDGVAATLSDRRSVVAEAHAAASQARASAVLLAALPVAVAVLLAVVDPSSVTVLVGTPMGWACLVAAVALDAVGLWWMRRLIGGIRC